jgi:CrcB protein
MFLVGTGGFIGSIARFLVTHYVNNLMMSAFPFATVMINITGSFLIGVIFGLSERFGWFGLEWRFFLAAGFCGGFTTFSAFSYETINLLRSGEWAWSLTNIFVSVAFCLSATFLGLLVVKVL